MSCTANMGTSSAWNVLEQSSGEKLLSPHFIPYVGAMCVECRPEPPGNIDCFLFINCFGTVVTPDVPACKARPPACFYASRYVSSKAHYQIASSSSHHAAMMLCSC